MILLLDQSLLNIFISFFLQNHLHAPSKCNACKCKLIVGTFVGVPLRTCKLIDGYFPEIRPIDQLLG